MPTYSHKLMSDPKFLGRLVRNFYDRLTPCRFSTRLVIDSHRSAISVAEEGAGIAIGQFP